MTNEFTELLVISRSTTALFWEKFMIGIIYTITAQILEQFSQSFGADSMLLLMLFSLVFLDLALSYMIMLKKRIYSAARIIQIGMKLPLFCLYLFLVGVIAVTLEHSIQFALPLLNLFIAYLAASETVSIVADLGLLNVKVPGLLMVLTTDFKKKIEGRLRSMAKSDDKPNKDDAA